MVCEQGLKIAAIKLKSQQYDMSPLLDAITALTKTVTSMQQDISSLKESSKKKKLSERNTLDGKQIHFQSLIHLLNMQMRTQTRHYN